MIIGPNLATSLPVDTVNYLYKTTTKPFELSSIKWTTSPFHRMSLVRAMIYSPVNRPVDPKQITTEIINTPAFSL